MPIGLAPGAGGAGTLRRPDAERVRRLLEGRSRNASYQGTYAAVTTHLPRFSHNLRSWQGYSWIGGRGVSWIGR